MASTKSVELAAANPATGAPSRQSPVYSGGNVRVFQATLKLDGQSAGDTVTLGALPRNAQIIEGFVLTAGGDDSENDVDIGFANDADCIADGLDITSAATHSILAGDFTGSNGIDEQDPVASYTKKIWELAGYSNVEDAPNWMDVIVTLTVGNDNGSSAITDTVIQLLYVVD